MDKTVLDLRPALLSAAGGILIIITSLLTWQSDVAHAVLLGGGILTLVGAFWHRLRLYQPDAELEKARHQVLFDQERLEEERRALATMKEDVEEEALLLEKRRHKLSLQLAQTVGWWDMDPGASAENPDAATSAFTEETDGAKADARDREVLAICKAESEQLFEKITRNDYVIDGKLQNELILKDAMRLFESVARVYRPDSDQPLLETSVEQLLRFVHSTSLQLLVQLEQLPLDVKSYNIRDTYRFVKRAMDYYGMYRKVSPYWNYAKPALFLSRFALGANPIALGLSWTLTELASLGGKRISTRYTRKYGLRLFHETIRILGSETAMVYGAEFRRRDPDWLYSLELIDLVHQFPPSRTSLEQSLKEIGSQPLRSEYDRVFLYRCLANRFSAKPQSARSREFLGMGDRVRVVQRLENFFSQHFATEDPDKVRKWRKGVEARLGVRMRLDGELSEGTRDEQLQSAFYSLTSYLLGHKMLEVDAAEEAMRQSRIASAMEADALSKSILQLRDAPPMVFDYPVFTPSEEVLEMYLEDLAQYQLAIFPHEPDTVLMEEATVYFRQKLDKWIDRLHEKATDHLTSTLDEGHPQPTLEPRIVQALLHDLGDQERLQILYPVAAVDGQFELHNDLKQFWLIGTNRRPLLLLGFQEGESKPVALWKPASQKIVLEPMRGLLSNYLRLSGGGWNREAVTFQGDAPTFRLKGRRSTGFDKHFNALESRLRQLGAVSTISPLPEKSSLPDYGKSTS